MIRELGRSVGKHNSSLLGVGKRVLDDRDVLDTVDDLELCWCQCQCSKLGGETRGRIVRH